MLPFNNFNIINVTAHACIYFFLFLFIEDFLEKHAIGIEKLFFYVFLFFLSFKIGQMFYIVKGGLAK